MQRPRNKQSHGPLYEILSTYSGAYGSHTIGHSVGPLVLTQFIDNQSILLFSENIFYDRHLPGSKNLSSPLASGLSVIGGYSSWACLDGSDSTKV